MSSPRARWFGLMLLVGIGQAPARDSEGPYVWNSVAIGGGGFVTGVTFHPHEAGLAYARTDVGGAYRWDSAAQRWIALTDWLGPQDDNLLGIESIAIDPSDAERVFLAAGTYLNAHAGNGAILRSSDRGRSFERSDLPFKLGGNEMGRGNGERLAVDPNDGRVLFFGSRGEGLWRSDNGGSSWEQVKSFPDIATSESARVKTSWAGTVPVGIVFVVFDPDSGRKGAPTPTLYAGVSTQRTSLYQSTDGGATWTAVKQQPEGLRPNHMVRASDGTFYLSYGDEPGPNTMNNGAVWKYTPASDHWKDITPAAQSTDTQGDGFGWGAVAVDPRNPLVLLATTFCRYGPNDDYRSHRWRQNWPFFPRSRFDHSARMARDATPHGLRMSRSIPSSDRIFVPLWTMGLAQLTLRARTVCGCVHNAGLEETGRCP